jgi:hypothetical protein
MNEMKRFVQGGSRTQSFLLPGVLEDYVTDTNPVVVRKRMAVDESGNNGRIRCRIRDYPPSAVCLGGEPARSRDSVIRVLANAR